MAKIFQTLPVYEANPRAVGSRIITGHKYFVDGAEVSFQEYNQAMCEMFQEVTHQLCEPVMREAESD